MSAELIRDLARAKAAFQMRAIVAQMGVHPDAAEWVSPTVVRLSAGSAEDPSDVIRPEKQ